MTVLRYSFRCLPASLVHATARAARRLALAGGLGLLLWAGGTARAVADEHGEAEAAPAVPVVFESSAATPFTAGGPSPVLTTARLAAHTAQLARPAPRGDAKLSKPLFPAERSGTPPATAPAAPGKVTTPSAPAPLHGPKATPPKAAAPAAARRTRLSLAPNEAEIRREIASRNGGPATVERPRPDTLGQGEPPKESTGDRLQERATAAPAQNRRWPTHVDYSAGPSGPAGGNIAGDRKGALIESTGPQQGVIRNRW